MTRHGLSNQTVALNTSGPAGKLAPIPRSGPTQSGMAGNSNLDCSLTPFEIALIRPMMALPDWQHLPSRTIPKPFYP
jgi:hypothetical protein